MGLAHWWPLILLALASALQITQDILSPHTNENLAAVKPAPNVEFPDLYEASVLELQKGLDAGHFTSVHLVKVCLISFRDLSRGTNV